MPRSSAPSTRPTSTAHRSSGPTASATLGSAKPSRGERPIAASDIVAARVLGPHTCACVRSPRAIAHWLLTHDDPDTVPTPLALDREEAALWASALTGAVRIEHSSVDGTCVLRLDYRDGRHVTITMDELRLAASATFAA